MNRFFVFLSTLAVASAAGGFKPGLRVKFDVGSNIGGSFFFDIPRTVSDARSEGWRRAKRPSSGHLEQLLMYCPTDKVLCALYDDTEYIAGLQVAIPQLEFSRSVFDWETRGFTSWYTAVDGVCKKFWTLQQYFVTEEFLAISAEDRLASRNSSLLLQAGGVWAVGTNKQLLKISSEEQDIIDEGLFTEQACIPKMGLHYCYNITTSTECTADQMYPWFPLVMNGELIASGFLTFGQLELPEGRDWFERPTAAVVQAIVPNGPECLYSLASDPGTVSMHIYYINEPCSVDLI